MNSYLNYLKDLLKGITPNLLASLAILIIGWIVAFFFAYVVRFVLNKTSLDNRLANWMGRKAGKTPRPVEIERIVSTIVYYVILLFVVIACLQTLGLSGISEPLRNFQNEIFTYLPRIFSAGILLFVAWLIATALKFILSNALNAFDLDRKFDEQVRTDTKEDGFVEASDEKTTVTDDSNKISLSSTLSNTVYWLVFLFFLPAILDALDLRGVLAPVNNMLNVVFSYIPNIVAAGIILLIGWFVAKVIYRILGSFLESTGIDRFSARVGANNVLGNLSLSEIISQVVRIAILIPVVISSLNALQIAAITEPATNLLNKIVLAIPNILLVILLGFVAYIIGKFVSDLLTSFLTDIGFDKLIYKTNVMKTGAKYSPSKVVGIIVMITVFLLISVEALGLLGFSSLSLIAVKALKLGANVAIGLGIFGVGLFLSNLAYNAIRNSGVTESNLLALISRILIILLSGAMALDQMGLANNIVILAFGLTVGAVAVASAIAFGIGGRDTAKRIVDETYSSYKGRSVKTK